MTTGKTDEFDYKAHAEKTAEQYRSFVDVTKMNVVELPRPSNPKSACKQIECLGELLRLQQVVVDAAKDFTNDDEPVRPEWNALVSYRRLCGAVDALKLFEANQK